MKQTVTFLFTDIEGSSRLWEQLGERMGSLLARHDALVRETVVAHGGAVVKFIGDGVHAAFADPHAALHCGVRLLSGVRDMPEGAGKLKLRAGLHVGVCEARDNDYFGETVNRAARIAHAAHGGQFIVSDAVASALNGAVSDSVSLRTLGRIRLRDLSGEETLHQVLHRDLPGDFPPLRSLSQAPNNLPNQRTSFIGRHAEVCKLAAQLDEHRLVTVVGTGGIGKTRLALQTGARVLERFEEGVWLIELAGIADAGRIAEALLSTWNLAVAPGNSAEDTLCEYLAPRRALLLLDNCEHLIDACAALVDLILRRAPNVKIVATSREPLDVDGESLYRIPGLPLPDPDFEGSVDALCEVEAVRLFVERARLQQPDWTVTPQDAPQLATLCYRLDGIPLAIELAAARMRDMALAELLRGIEDRFGFLVTGSRVAPPRHKTLAGMIDWSCRLLKPAEQRLFRRLAVFQGGIPAPLALRVCADPALAPDEIETALVELAGKSLLTGGEGRFGMLETLRQFAAGELQQADEMHATQRAHALAFAAWAAPISEELRALSAGEQTALLMRDEENLSRALEFALTQPDCGNTALSLAASMGLYWQHRGGSKHSAGMLHRALQHPGADRISADRVHVEYARAVLAYLDADMGAAKRHAIGSRDIARELRLDAAAARAQTMVAYATYVQDGYAASRAFFLQAMDDCRAANLENSRLIAACNFATNAFFAGDHSAAHATWEEARRDNENVKSTRVAASLLQLRGLFALSSGQLDDALEAFNDFLRQVIETHETQREGVAHFHLGKALDAMGRSDEALASFQQAIRLLAERQLTLELLNALEAFAGMLARHSAYEPSCLVCAVTAATRERMGYRPGDQANAARSAALGPAEQAIDSQTLARITGTGRVTPLTALVGWTAAAEMRRDAASGTTQIWLPASP